MRSLAAALALGITTVASAQEVVLTASDGQVSDEFGLGVAVSGDIVVVGAYADDAPSVDSGSAYVFVREATGWVEETQLTASDGDIGDWFGLRVAASGDTALVGAALDDDDGTDSGSAYVYVRSGSTWSEQQKLHAPDAAAGDQFGRWVGLDGDSAIVCNYLDDHSGLTDAGSAHIFVRNGTTWSWQAKLTASDPGENDQFARSVSISGDTAVIGAHRHDIGGATNAGAAYIFVRNGTNWSQQRKLTAPDFEMGDQFGGSIFVNGNTLVVGANKDDTAAGFNAGSVYVYVRNGTSWSLEVKLEAFDAETTDQFGRSVGISGDNLIVGTIFDDANELVDTGSAYLYQRSGTAWSLNRKFVPATAGAGDLLGYTVAVAGDTYVAGSYLHDAGGVTDAGAAFLLDLGSRGYCTAGVSAAGCRAVLSTSGTARSNAPSGFTLSAEGVEGSKDGLFFFGTAGRHANAWGNGSSLQCVVPPVTRAGLLSASGTSGACNGSFAQDLNALWCPTCPKPAKNPGAGAIVQAQLWYRDPASTSSVTTGLSDAVEFTVWP